MAAHPVAESVDAVSVVVEPLGGRRRVSGLRSLRCCRLHRRRRHHLCPCLSIKCTQLSAAEAEGEVRDDAERYDRAKEQSEAEGGKRTMGSR